MTSLLSSGFGRALSFAAGSVVFFASQTALAQNPTPRALAQDDFQDCENIKRAGDDASGCFKLWLRQHQRAGTPQEVAYAQRQAQRRPKTDAERVVERASPTTFRYPKGTLDGIRIGDTLWTGAPGSEPRGALVVTKEGPGGGLGPKQPSTLSLRYGHWDGRAPLRPAPLYGLRVELALTGDLLLGNDDEHRDQQTNGEARYSVPAGLVGFSLALAYDISRYVYWEGSAVRVETGYKRAGAKSSSVNWVPIDVAFEKSFILAPPFEAFASAGFGFNYYRVNVFATRTGGRPQDLTVRSLGAVLRGGAAYHLSPVFSLRGALRLQVPLSVTNYLIDEGVANGWHLRDDRFGAFGIQLGASYLFLVGQPALNGSARRGVVPMPARQRGQTGP